MRELEEARSWEKTIHINKIEDRTREHLKLNDMFRIGKAALKADGSEIRGSVVLGADVEETFIKIAFDGGNSIDISHYDLKDGKIYTISFPKDAAKALKKIL